MFDFLRNIRKSAEEKRLERVNAYLDGELSPREQEQFDQELAQDEALRAEVDALRQIQMSVRRLPRVRAPRNYTLDPAVYGRPARTEGWQLYPMLRVATALTAFFFIIALALDLMTPAGVLGEPVAGLLSPAAGDVQETMADTAVEGEIAMEEMAVEEMEEPVEEEAAVEMAPMEADAPDAVQPEIAAEETAASMAETVEVTRLVTEGVTEEEAAEVPDGAAPAPGVAQADEAEARATATAAVEATEMVEAGDGDDAALALPPGATVVADDVQAPSEPSALLPTPVPGEVARATDDTPDPFPWLLLAEILLGVGLVGLVIMTLIARRSA
ncbi:MAG TPA: hypothetical protein VK879_09240 [Candidatus Sulfomarinibacteraceae bacterium]|nr:hypothetical protein [Candidatus Sulfomarinibacteraceae bacterium]